MSAPPPEKTPRADDLARALAKQDYPRVIELVRTAVQDDPLAALADPAINDWMGKRFRNIFVTEALASAKVRKDSQAPFPLNLADPRNDREKVAKRMIAGISDDEIALEMPAAEPGAFKDTALVFAPGLLTGLLPSLAFDNIWPTMIDRFGVKIALSNSHPMRSSEANVADLENALERGIGISPLDSSVIGEHDDPTPPGDVVLMGYSKGAPDILALLAKRPDLAPRIKGVIGWAGAVGGSYIADDVSQKIQGMPEFDVVSTMAGDIGRQVMRLAPVVQMGKINTRLDEYDIKGAIRSLTTGSSEAFLSEHAEQINDLGIPMFNFTGSTHLMEVPYYQRPGMLTLLKYDKHNDMQLTQAQAMLPLPTAPHLAMFHANHWDLSYNTFPWYTTLGSTKLRNPFAREAAIAAILLFMSELGLMR